MTKGYASIWVIVDRLTKLAHFILIKIICPLQKLIELYIEKMVSLHGIPSSILSDRDPRLISWFWQSLQEALGTTLKLSFAYNLQADGQTDGQTERTSIFGGFESLCFGTGRYLG